MDTLAKQKLIDTRDFLIELLIVGDIQPHNTHNVVKLQRAVDTQLATWGEHENKIILTNKGHAFINEHKDLV